MWGPGNNKNRGCGYTNSQITWGDQLIHFQPTYDMITNQQIWKRINEITPIIQNEAFLKGASNSVSVFHGRIQTPHSIPAPKTDTSCTFASKLRNFDSLLCTYNTTRLLLQVLHVSGRPISPWFKRIIAELYTLDFSWHMAAYQNSWTQGWTARDSKKPIKGSVREY